MDIRTVNIKDIRPYPNNPRKNDGAVAAVAESIKQCGYCSPIVVDEDMVVLAGHTRLKAVKRLGWTECEVCVREGLTEEQKRKYRLLDNKTNELAAWDDELLAQELMDLDFAGFDFDWGVEDCDEFGVDFSLPDGDKPEICQMTFTLHQRQKELIEYALSCVGDGITETFGNTNKNGNALYEVVRQWAAQKT